MAAEKPSSPSEIRKVSIRLWTGPSGFKYRIAKPGILDFLKIFNIPLDRMRKMAEKPPKPGEIPAEMSRIDTAEIIEKLIPTCVLEPKVVLEGFPEDAINIREIPDEDLIELTVQIGRWLEEATKEARETKNFPSQP